VRPHGALLIFDEVMTGFRVAFGGATEAFGVTPDLVTLGKVVGGGLPVAAYGGRAALMQHVAPVGRMYQAGTLSGNPLAMAGGLATLAALTREVHDGIVARTATLVEGCARSPSGTACRARRGTPGRCGASSSTRARCARSTTPRRATSPSSAASSTRRSTAACTSRRRRSRPGSRARARRRRDRQHARAAGRGARRGARRGRVAAQRTAVSPGGSPRAATRGTGAAAPSRQRGTLGAPRSRLRR
jgi:hypothetical protein